MAVGKDSVKKYKAFHGHEPRFEEEIEFTVPKDLIILGKAVAIEYKTDKLNGGGDGKMAVYRHKFDTPSYVCMDQTGKRQLYIIGNRLKVTRAGIEN
jgi:hypothetical protein